MPRVGRPLSFETPQELEDAINAYFEATPEGELTVTGLANAIGTTRQGLINYENRDDYDHLVRQAKSFIEHDYELALRRQGRAGDIFGLKNFGWKDKTEHELGGPGGGAIPVNWNVTGVRNADRSDTK